MFRLLLVALVATMVISGCTENMLSEPDLQRSGDSPTGLAEDGKLRNPHFANLTGSTASKDGVDESQLFVAFNEYEADGVTRRVLDGYGITRRVLEEYGITRRVLEEYGISRRVLEEYGVSRRVMESYAITRRVLESYGITAADLEANNYDISRAFLRNFGVSFKDLEAHGVSRRVLDDYGVSRRVLDDYGVSDAAYDAALAAWERTIKLKVRIDSARPGIFISLGSLSLATFLDEIASDTDIAFAEIDLPMQMPVGAISHTDAGSELLPWGVSDIGAVESQFLNAGNVRVYVLDSGVYKNDLLVEEEKDFTMLFENRSQTHWDDSAIMSMPYFDPGHDGNPADETGHGSHIAGTIAAQVNDHQVVGVAPGARIHSLKVMTSAGQTDITTLLAALDYVIAQKHANPTQAMVVNMSLGMDIQTTAYNVLDEGVKRAVENGILVVVSAGNSGQDASTFSPAHVAEALTVGSYGQTGAASTFSNFGPVVDLFAPGEMIASLSNNPNDVAANYAVLDDGTSMAAAHVTGAAALILAETPQASPSVITDALLGKARPSVTGVTDVTTNLAVWAAPGKSGGEASGSVTNSSGLPPFYNFAITAGLTIDIYESATLWTGFEDPTSSGNASLFSNKFLDLDNGNSTIRGFSYNAEAYQKGSDVQDPEPATWASWMQEVPQPNYNPSGLPGNVAVDAIDIPYLDVDQFKGLATRVSNKDLTLRGHYELGTRENPTIWFVNGNMRTREAVTFSGYGVFLVKGAISISHDITGAEGKAETTLGLYANNSITFKSAGLTVAAHIFTNNHVLVLKELHLYGNITAGGTVAWKTESPNELFFREPPRLLTNIFWPVN